MQLAQLIWLRQSAVLWQAEEDSKQSAEAVQAIQQEADKQEQAVTTAEAACKKVQFCKTCAGIEHLLQILQALDRQAVHVWVHQPHAVIVHPALLC